MINRIEENEQRLDNLIKCIKDMDMALTKLKAMKKDINILKRYYGSKNWFKDRDNYEKDKLTIKAFVLSEDGVWNTLDDLDTLIKEMELTVKSYKN